MSEPQTTPQRCPKWGCGATRTDRCSLPECPPLTMQEVVGQLGATKEEASAMMRHGFEMVAMGARLYGAFLSGEAKR